MKGIGHFLPNAPLSTQNDSYLYTPAKKSSKASLLMQSQKTQGFFKAGVLPRQVYRYGIEGLRELFSNLRSDFPNFSELQFVREIDGGTGGVSVFKDLSTGKLWTLKTWKNRGHAINECLAACLNQLLGGHSPAFSLFSHLPKELQHKNGFKHLKNGDFYRLAQFIEGKEPDKEELEKKIQSSFIVLALLSFWDIKPKNYILSKDGKLYLIDTGGSLFYSAMGDLKKVDPNNWMPHQVSELATFRDGHFKHPYFASINQKQIHQQIREVGLHAQAMIRLVKNFCQAVEYEKTQEITYSLQSRLRHLQFLYHYFNGALNPKADPFEIASNNDAAGTLIYGSDQNHTYILIGKRSGHQWWSNLGGGAHTNETFFDAAGRETKEESGGYFQFDTGLIFTPSHDLVTVDEHFLLKRYRTHLVQHDWVDPEELKRAVKKSAYHKEYTEFKWIRIDKLLNVLYDEAKHQFVEEGKKTVILDKECILYPPFLESLRQPNVRYWLQNLANGQAVEATCTQSISGQNALKKINERLDHSASEAFRMAVWMTVALQNRTVTVEIPKKRIESAKIHSASLNMLKHLLPKKFHRLPLSAQIKEATKDDLKLSDANIALVARIIEQEKVHGNKMGIYHGLMPNLWLQYRILSHIRHILNGTPIQTDVLRPLDSFFSNFSNANDLIDFIVKGRNNYSAGFKRAGMSFNPSVFSNLKTPTSCTLGMLFGFENREPPKDVWGIVKTLFEKIGVVFDDLTESLEMLYQSQFHDKKRRKKEGALLQIFLDPTIVNEACYIAASVGAEVKDKNGQIVRNSNDVLRSIKMGQDPQLSERMERLQVRLLADISKYNEGLVVVQDYFSDDSISIASIDAEIKKFIQSHLFVIIRSLPHLSDVYSRREPRVIEIQRRVMGLQAYERKKEEPEIVKLLRQNDHFASVVYIMEDPLCLDYSYRDPDTLAEVTLPVRVKNSKLLGKIREKEGQLLLSILKILMGRISSAQEGIDLIQNLYHRLHATTQNVDLDNIIGAVDLLIKPRMTLDQIVTHLYAMCQVVIPNLRTVLSVARHLIQPEYDERIIIPLIEAMAAVEVDSRENVLDFIRDLFSQMFKKFTDHDLIKIVHELGTLRLPLKDLLQKVKNEGVRVDICEAFHGIDRDEAAGVIQEVSKHFNKILHDERDIIALIQAMVSVEAGSREDVFAFIQDLFPQMFRKFTVPSLLKTVQELGALRVPSKEFLQKVNSEEVRVEICKAIHDLDRDEAPGVILGVSKHFNKTQHDERDIIALIQAMASVAAGSQEDVFTFVRDLFPQKFRKFTARSLLKTVQELGNLRAPSKELLQTANSEEVREDVCKAILEIDRDEAPRVIQEVTHHFIKAVHDERDMIALIQVMASVEAGSREDVFTFIQDLFSQMFRKFTAPSLLKTVQGLGALRAPSKELLQKVNSEEVREDVCKGILGINGDEAPGVIQAVSKHFNKTLHDERDMSALISAMASVEAGSREDVLEFIRDLFPQKFRNFADQGLLKTVQDLGSLRLPSKELLQKSNSEEVREEVCKAILGINRDEAPGVMEAAAPIVPSSKVEWSKAFQLLAKAKSTHRASLVAISIFIQERSKGKVVEIIETLAQFEDVDFHVVLDALRVLTKPSMIPEDVMDVSSALCKSHLPNLPEVAAAASVLVTFRLGEAEILRILQATSRLESSSRGRIITKVEAFQNSLKKKQKIAASALIEQLSKWEESRHPFVFETYEELMDQRIEFSWIPTIFEELLSSSEYFQMKKWIMTFIECLVEQQQHKQPVEISEEEFLLAFKAIGASFRGDLPNDQNAKWYYLLATLIGIDEKDHRGIFHAATKTLPSSMDENQMQTLLKKLTEIREILPPHLSAETLHALLACTSDEQQLIIEAVKLPKKVVKIKRMIRNLISIKSFLYTGIKEARVYLLTHHVDKVKYSDKALVLEQMAKLIDPKKISMTNFSKILDLLITKYSNERQLIDKYTGELIELVKSSIKDKKDLERNESYKEEILQALAGVNSEWESVVENTKRFIANGAPLCFLSSIITNLGEIKSNDERSKITDQVLELKRLGFYETTLLREFKNWDESDRDFVVKAVPQFGKLQKLEQNDIDHLKSLKEILPSKRTSMLKSLLDLHPELIKYAFDLQTTIKIFIPLSEEEIDSIVKSCLALFDSNSLRLFRTEFIELMAKCEVQKRPAAAKIAIRLMNEREKSYFFYSSFSRQKEEVFKSVFEELQQRA